MIAYTNMITRKNTRKIKIGNVEIGGGSPISVQSMTNVSPVKVYETLSQIERLKTVGCDIARIAVPDIEAAKKIGEIKKRSPLPLVADIHFDHRLALEAVEQGIDALRINPGNIGNEAKIEAVVMAAKGKGIPIRVGVNAGSLEKEILSKYGRPTAEALVESTLKHVRLLERMDFRDIKISIKSHDVLTTIYAYRLLSEKVDYPLHIGITEAGPPFQGTIKSAVGLGILLAEGIGDTIRVSLTADPTEEVKAAIAILKALGLREGGELISCPTCGRCEIDLIELTKGVEEMISGIPMGLKVAVMGCGVNGPGEAKEAHVGVAGGKGCGLIFRRGKVVRKVKEEDILQELGKEISSIIQEERKMST